MFQELNQNELMRTDGGLPFVIGVLAAGGIIVVSSLATAGAVVLVGKAAQKFADWIG